jgi:UDP-N-acetylmuramate: L-alanyl-gamma-D-glutamyl-meso-diaminopimelate ligase
MIETLVRNLSPGDHVLVMSNGGFGGVHDKLLERLRAQPRKVPA